MKVGEKLPDLVWTLELHDLVTYAGATWDWYRVHYDPIEVERLKLRGALVDGQMLGALLARQATAWAGPKAAIRRMNFRLRSMVFAGDTVRCESRVDAINGKRITLGQRVVVRDQSAVEPASLELELFE